MKKYFLLMAFAFGSIASAQTVKEAKEALKEEKDTRKSIYDYHYKITDINGKTFEWDKLKGKKVLVVNTASKCGNTPQYNGLEQLQKKYGGKKFTVIGFPCNQFGGQEPGSAEEIKKFCEASYGVDFPIMAKSDVKGKDANPIYQFLTRKDLNGASDNEVTWNFQKFLINEEGKLDGVFPPKKNPASQEIISWIEGKKDKE